MKIGILEPLYFSTKVNESLESIGIVKFYHSGNDLKLFLSDKDIIFVRLGFKINVNFLKHAKSLKYICSPTTGTNHIDLKLIRKKNIKLISLKGEAKFLENIRATPEHSFGLLLALLRKYKTSFLNKNNVQWDRNKCFGEEIFDNKVGIIGLGRVGSLIAKYSDAFGAKIYFYDIKPKKKSKKNYVKENSIVKLIEKSNIIFLCASYEENTSSFILGEEELSLFQDKYLINTSRGELIDEEKLYIKIKENFFKGVAIDVLSNETGKNNFDKFLKLTNNRNLIITPHIAGATYNSINRTEKFIFDKLILSLRKNGYLK